MVHAEEGLFICATNAAKQISDTIRDKGLNRVVVAACTPRTHEPLFRDTLREGGINQYFFDMANIREHCSWVHSKQKEEATSKAKDIVRMSVARAAKLEPLDEFDLPVNKSGPGGRRRPGRHDQRAEPGRPGLRGPPGGEGDRTGRHGAAACTTPSRGWTCRPTSTT